MFTTFSAWLLMKFISSLLYRFLKRYFFNSTTFLAVPEEKAIRFEILISAEFFFKNLKRAFATIQPQLFTRNLPTNQALYRFLLDEGVVNQNIAYRETMGLIDDVVKSGGNLDRLLNTFSKKFKKAQKIAQDAYTAEDDAWRIFNFAGYFKQLSKNYSNAVA